jgi:hypothetical protein
MGRYTVFLIRESEVCFEDKIGIGLDVDSQLSVPLLPKIFDMMLFRPGKFDFFSSTKHSTQCNCNTAYVQRLLRAFSIMRIAGNLSTRT